MTKNQKSLGTDEKYLVKCLGQAGDLTKEEMAQTQEFVLRYRHIFRIGDFDLGHTDKLKHGIDLEDEVPFKQRHRRIPPAVYQEVRTYLQQLLDRGIIRESNSPNASSVVLVRKKNG